MNSNYGKGSAPGSLSNFNFDFDLGLGSSRSKPLNDQKNRTTSSFSSSYSSSSSSSATKSTWQPNKPSWTHQPAPAQSARPGLPDAPTSMVGDIFGKTWASTGPSKSTSGIGIVDKNPNLFGDLVTSALGQGNKGSGNVPLKNAAPVSNKNSYSMGNLADALPKTNANTSTKISGSWESGNSFGNYSSGYKSSSASNGSNMNVNINANVGVGVNKSTNLGGAPMKGMSGNGMRANKDPFGSLFESGLKQSGSTNSATKGNNKPKPSAGDDGFGDFQNASKPSTTAFPSSANNDFMGGSNMGTGFGDFGAPAKDYGSKNQSSGQGQSQSQSTGGDPLDMFFSSSSASATASGGGQQFSELDDWGVDSDFGGGHDDGGTTTELEGLPPPPAGVTGGSAKNKGVENQKAGQYADAIKWLSWAVILLEKSGDKVNLTEVLSARASCYKEVGEYKKAVADCSKVVDLLFTFILYFECSLFNISNCFVSESNVNTVCLVPFIPKIITITTF